MNFRPANLLAALPFRNNPLGWLAFAMLGIGAVVFLCALFLDIPIGTEARDYVYYHGFLANGPDWLGLVYPIGTNTRLISLLGFALGSDVCGLGTECLNGLQILLLLLCLAVGALHLNQLLGRPILAALCISFWCFSLPLFEAGYWQATQHDKLACLFSLGALSLGLAAIRRGGSKLFLVCINLILTCLFLLALNSKEIAFCLPAAVMAQLAFLVPEPGWRARLRAARFYALPMAYAIFYITVYMLRLKAGWQGHVMSGDPLANSNYYEGSLMGRLNSSTFLFSLAFTLVAVFSFLGTLLRRTRATGAWAYLLVVFAANMLLVIRAQYPDNFYLLLADWAASGWVGASFATLAAQKTYLRIPGTISIALVACVFLNARFLDLLSGGSAELLHQARVFDAGYRALRPYCGARMRGGVKFVFGRPPAGVFYFFRGGMEGQDPLVGSFICHDGTTPAMSYAYDGNAKPDHPGQLVVIWTDALKPVVAHLAGE